MGRLTEILCSTQLKVIPNNEQLFHIDISNPHDRAEIVLLRKIKKEEDQLELF
jgi:hypothetical protein